MEDSRTPSISLRSLWRPWDATTAFKTDSTNGATNTKGMNMKNLFLILCVFVVGLLGGQYVSKMEKTGATESAKVSVYENVRNTGVLRCGYVNWKPYYYLDMENGGKQATGINVDLMNELAKVAGLKIEWTEEINWGNVGEGFKTNRYDAVCTTIWPDAAKIRNLNLSRPYFFTVARACLFGLMMRGLTTTRTDLINLMSRSLL